MLQQGLWEMTLNATGTGGSWRATGRMREVWSLEGGRWLGRPAAQRVRGTPGREDSGQRPGGVGPVPGTAGGAECAP